MSGIQNNGTGMTQGMGLLGNNTQTNSLIDQKAINELNERYKNDDHKMMQEELNEKQRKFEKKKADKLKGIDKNLIDELEESDEEYKKETKPLLDESEINKHHNFIDVLKKNIKKRDDEENAFLSLEHMNVKDVFDNQFDDPDLAPKKISNLNLKERFAHINAMIDSSKPNSQKPSSIETAFDSLNIEKLASFPHETMNTQKEKESIPITQKLNLPSNKFSVKDENADPLDQFMKGISTDAVKQESFNL